MSLPKSLTINDTTYALADLTDAARNQVANVQAVDAEIARLQQSLAISQTARSAYVAALLQSVEAKPAAEKAAKPRAKKA